MALTKGEINGINDGLKVFNGVTDVTAIASIPFGGEGFGLKAGTAVGSKLIEHKLEEKGAEKLGTKAAEKAGTKGAEKLGTKAAEKAGTKGAEKAGEKELGKKASKHMSISGIKDGIKDATHLGKDGSKFSKTRRLFHMAKGPGHLIGRAAGGAVKGTGKAAGKTAVGATKLTGKAAGGLVKGAGKAAVGTAKTAGHAVGDAGKAATKPVTGLGHLVNNQMNSQRRDALSQRMQAQSQTGLQGPSL